MDQRQKKQWGFSITYLVVASLILYSIQLMWSPQRARNLAYSDFVKEVRAGHLEQVNITERELVGLLKKDAAKENQRTITATRLPGIDEAPLIRDLESKGVKFSGEIQARSWWVDMLLAWIVPLGFLFLVYGYGMWKMQRGGVGPLSFGRNQAKIYDETSRMTTTFSDVAGVDEAKAELVEIVDFLKQPQKYQRLGGRIPRGVLLVGPPGTGKTLLARAVAGEAAVPFFSISGSQFVEMFVGVGAARVRDLFEQAKQKAPCIVFIDELDAIGKSRSGAAGFVSHDERDQTLNQLLVEMDGFDTSKGVILMAATNTPEVLDQALLRPGRFDRQVIVDRPDMEGREAILKVHARKVSLAPDADLKTLAARTPGMVGADLANIVNEAALLAARRGASGVEMRDLEEATDRVTLGLEKKSRCMSVEEKERVAYHETGHALVALFLPHADPVHRVSIIPRSVGALGHTLQLPTQEKFLMTRPELEDRLAVLLGGRAAEEIIYDGVISTGAADDLERASELARQMVTRFGMSDVLGQATWGRRTGPRFLPQWSGEERNFSEETARQIDAEVRRMIETSHDKVLDMLRLRKDDVERIARELIRKETLDRRELDRLIREPVAA